MSILDDNDAVSALFNFVSILDDNDAVSALFNFVSILNDNDAVSALFNLRLIFPFTEESESKNVRTRVYAESIADVSEIFSFD